MTLHLLCYCLWVIFCFKTVFNTGLHLVLRLWMSGAAPLFHHIHSLCSAVQAYFTSLIYPTIIMFRTIVLYLLCTMYNVGSNVECFFSLHELPQPAKHSLYYSRTLLVRTLVVRIASCPIGVGTTGKFFVNSTKITCLQITGYRIQFSAVAWLLELYTWRCRNIFTQVLTVNINSRNSVCQ